MATKKKPAGKRPSRKSAGNTVSLLTQNRRLEREVKTLREENRQLKRSLGALLCKDEPRLMDLTPEDGVMQPSLDDLIKEIERPGK